MGDGGLGGGLGSNLTWQELDEKVNIYPRWSCTHKLNAA
jgi:hypothetical protein